MGYANSWCRADAIAALLAIACGPWTMACAASHWAYVPPLGSPWAPQAAVIADLDGDGTDEVVALGAASSHWPFLSRLGALAAYAWHDESPTPVGLRATGGYVGVIGVRAIATRDLPGLPGDSVLAYGCENRLWTCVLRGPRLELAARFPITPEPVFVGDLTGEGRHQAVALAGTRFEVYDLVSGKLDYRSAEFGSSIHTIKVGRFGGGNKRDLVVLACPGGIPCRVHVFDGGDFSEKWTHTGAGYSISVGPANQSRDWLAITSLTGSAIIVEGSPLNVAREFVPAPWDDPDRYQLLDTDDDGSSELLSIMASELEVIDGNSLQPRFRTRADIGDAELIVARHPDGNRRLVWKDTDADESLHVLAPHLGAVVQAQVVEWIGAVAVGNIDTTPADEVVFLSSSYDAYWGRAVPRLGVLDRNTGLERWSLPMHQQYPPLQLALLPTATDAPDRILLAAWSHTGGNSVAVVDGKERRIVYSLGERNPELAFENSITAMRVGDVDGDGTSELVLTSGGRLYVIDPTASSIRWQLALPEWNADIHIIAHGPGLAADIVVAQETTVSLVSASTRQIRWTTMVNEYGGFNDINCVTYAGIGEAGPEIILRHDWTLTYLGAGDGQILRRNSLVPYYNDNTCFISAPSGRVDRLLVAANGLRIFNGLDGHIDPRLPTWPVGEEAGAFNAAHVEADPQSGRHEVVIGSMGGISALSVFDRIEIFAGGFEH